MKTNKLDSALQYLQEKHYAEWCSHYGEPGYSDPDKGIILANWNDIPEGLIEWLEKCGYSLEWSDEWTIDYDYSKAYRTSPNSYHWEPSIMLPAESCEYLTPDDDVSEWIEACQITSNGQPVQCLPSWIGADEIINAGFTAINEIMESGHFPGQTDNPADIARKLFDSGAYRVVFRKIENSQFYCKFETFADFLGESA